MRIHAHARVSLSIGTLRIYTHTRTRLHARTITHVLADPRAHPPTRPQDKRERDSPVGPCRPNAQEHPPSSPHTRLSERSCSNTNTHGGMASFHGFQMSRGASSSSYGLGASVARMAGGGMGTYGGGGVAGGYGVYGSGAAGLGLGLGGGYGVAMGQGGLSLQTGLGASRGYAVGYGGGLGLGLAAGGGGGALLPYGSPAFAAGRSMLSGGLAGGHPPLSLATVPPLATRNGHKATLQGLNQRFTGYVEKAETINSIHFKTSSVLCH
uniref:Keratin, type I cytoskeletal 9-like n=1 Tax=Petromyzon marinus TaxID=7757 RepID=A0AAJ7SL44_PETMA|nr:keratin, type I cytoskeletal 9-like [Petromyzon marinus]